MPVACGNEFSQAVAPWKFTSHHQTWVRTWGTYPNRPFQSKPVPARFAWFTISGGTLSVFPFIPLRGIISQAWVDKLPGHLTETRTPISTLKGWPPSQLEDETIIIFLLAMTTGIEPVSSERQSEIIAFIPRHDAWAFLSLTQDRTPRKEKQHRTPLPCIGDRTEVRTPITSLRGSLPSQLEDTAK